MAGWQKGQAAACTRHFPACPRPPDALRDWENPTCQCWIHPTRLVQGDVLCRGVPQGKQPGTCAGSCPHPRMGTSVSACPWADPKSPSLPLSP